MPDLATKESAVVDTTRDDAALPKWLFHSALSLNHCSVSGPFVPPHPIPHPYRAEDDCTISFPFFFFGHIKCLIVSSTMGYFLGVIVLRICHLTETRAMGTVQYDGSRPYTFKAKENRP